MNITEAIHGGADILVSGLMSFTAQCGRWLMPIYEIQSDQISPIEETSFAQVGLRERDDMQRLLRAQIEIISPETLVIAEEFCEWEDSRRRIDLLAIDKNANLVVIELKVTQDGGHMELQAVRYAAMVSAMTFEKAAETYSRYLRQQGNDVDARESLLSFLGWAEPDEDTFAQDVRIVLVSADFSKEITTAVMWLNDQGLDVRCVRMKPYHDTGRVLIDVQQVIPLPEAQEYQIQIREKVEKERIQRADRGDRQHLRYDFWQKLLDAARPRTDLHANISPCRDGWISAGGGVSGVHFSYSIRQHDAASHLILESEKKKNKAAFDFLKQRQDDIEKSFGGSLEWSRCDELKKSHIGVTLSIGGYRNDPSEWPDIQNEMIDSMIRLAGALSEFIPELKPIMQGIVDHLGVPEPCAEHLIPG